MNQRKAQNHWLETILSVLLPLLLSGCALFGHAGAQRIEEVHLFGLPTALVAPESSLPEGIGVRVYASEAGGSHSLPIQEGRLDVLMFDQSATRLNPQTQKPLKLWSFQAKELAPFHLVTMIGACYQLELRWNQDRPKGRVVTVVARYRGPDNSELYSTPTTIALTSH